MNKNAFLDKNLAPTLILGYVKFIMLDNLATIRKVFHSATVIGLCGFVTINSQKEVRAQVTADDTIGTAVKTEDGVAEITGGKALGQNLFHSFSEFSVGAGKTAFFNNSTDINNIIGRVTGNSISEINGLIRANGESNLVLINPNGINFGANARLNIGGSFLGSTAESVLFEDGSAFSARSGEVTPLLTVSAPVGLQLGTNSAAIEVEGLGHNLSLDTPIFSPFNRGNISGLKIQTGKTLGLVGGDIFFRGGVIASENGRIELGSVGSGIVDLNFGSENLSLSYGDVATFKNISFTQQSLVDASGSNSGAIKIQAKAISLEDGSAVLLQNLGNEISGDLEIRGTESISLTGISADGVTASGLYTEALGTGNGGKIELATPQLEVSNGASIITFSSGDAPSGDIQIDGEKIEIIGFSEIVPNKFSIISAQAYGAGDAGDIEVTTQNLTILNGGNIASVTGGAGTGSGGDVRVSAAESIQLTGVNPIALAPSQITAGSGGEGQAGNVALQTRNLTLKDGGRVDASATASGDAGSLTIDATESIRVIGEVPGSLNPSLIIASANILDPQLRLLFGLPDLPSGNSGNITIDTPQLQVMNGGQITVRNDGTGDAGNIQIKSNSIDLSNDGGITAAVETGKGGTINLEVANSLNLTGGAQIASDNHGLGDGGEISVSANTLEISDRSFITTTTFSAGKGGNISLNILESIKISGLGLEKLQEDFLASSLNGTLKAGTRGTGIFIGTAAGGVGGNLQIDTSSLSLINGGIIFGPIFTNGTGGDLEIAANDITIAGSALQISAGVETSPRAAAGDIFIDTQRLHVQDGGLIVNATFGDAKGGDINIDAVDSISFQDTPAGFPLFTGIYANTSRGSGNGGNIHLNTQNLLVDDALISSTTGGFIDSGLDIEGGGDAGNILIAATDTIKIAGLRIPDDPRFASGISSNSFTDGAAGDIEIFSDNLLILDGSEIAATTIGSGKGGNITVNVNNSVDLVGRTNVNNMQRGGLVATSGSDAFPQQQATGASGSIKIEAGNLNIERGASIDVQSIDEGSAGDLNLIVDNSLTLDKAGTISAATNFGTGGNITIDAGNIFWRGNSTTTARARGNADGGNINIQGRNLVVLESSQLTAEANIGQGGNIDIDAQGLFICNQCLVSASSQLGIDGVVDIDTLEPNSNLDIVEVPIELTQAKDTVAQACSLDQKDYNSRLTINGRGGLPTRPSDALRDEAIVSLEVPQNLTQPRQSGAAKNIESHKLPPPAQNWYLNSQGVVVLTAKSAATTKNYHNFPDCHAR